MDRSNKESAQKVNSREENSPAAPAGIRTRNLSITSPALLPTSNTAVTETAGEILGIKERI